MENLAQAVTQMKVFFSTAWQTIFEIGRMSQPAVKRILLVMFGGSLGAVSRYGVSVLAAKAWGANFPWGTLVVNLTGCFLAIQIYMLKGQQKMLIYR